MLASSNLILVVEDNEICRCTIEMQLASLGFESHSSVHGRDALERLSSNSYGLIFMDLQMPIMGGIETAKAIRALEQQTGQARTPIIAMTANPNRDGCLEAGIDDFLLKPILLAALREMLERWLPTGH
ncbi:MAG: response regulator [Candidatus Melainabacteria bacterium]|nr:response regulator [Candidatus Melainabacteria bacterium]